MGYDEKIVREFFDAWDGPDPRGAFDEHLAEDCVWLNTGLPTLEGKQACMQLVDVFLGHFPKIRIDVTEIASNADVVFVQRTDNCLDPDGEVAAVIEVAGVLTLRNGKIVRWHDYFDPSPFAALTGA
jgi:limonene-1,2-epoxide hydrolase